jgi:hypothetical protein
MQRARALNRLEQAGMTVYAIRNLLHDMGNVPYAQIDSILLASGITLGTTAYYSAKYLFSLGQSVITQLDRYITPDNQSKTTSHNISPNDEMVKRLRTEDDDMGRRRPAPGEPHANDAPVSNTEPNPRLRAQERDDNDMTSLAVNLTSGLRTETSSSRTGMHGETEIDNIPITRFNPFSRVSQAYLPYFIRKASTPVTATGCNALTFRLNSIYDCEASNTYVDVGVPTADTADATVNTPFMRGYWSQIYQYWTVIKSEWKVTVIPVTESINNELMVYVYEHGAQKPPYVNAGTALFVNHQMKKRHPGCRYKRLKMLPKVVSNTAIGEYMLDYNVNDYAVSFSGEWYPGKIKHEIAEDELMQTWNSVSEVPPTQEGLSIHVQQSPHSNASISCNYIVEFAITYTVQYKDLVATLQYLTESTDVPTSTNFGTQTN